MIEKTFIKINMSTSYQIFYPTFLFNKNKMMSMIDFLHPETIWNL